MPRPPEHPALADLHRTASLVRRVLAVLATVPLDEQIAVLRHILKYLDPEEP